MVEMNVWYILRKGRTEGACIWFLLSRMQREPSLSDCAYWGVGTLSEILVMVGVIFAIWSSVQVLGLHEHRIRDMWVPKSSLSSRSE
jgi:hypothetical protein